MLARLWSIPLLLLFFVLPSARAQARPAGSYSVHTVSHHIELSLKVARRSYPQNALVAVTASIRNDSRHTVWIQGGGPQSPGKTFPQVEVLNDAGKVLYPPALPAWAPLPGPGPVAFKMGAGKRFTMHDYVVLAASHLEVTVPIVKNRQPGRIVANVTTKPLTLQLTLAQAPAVTLTAAHGEVSAVIQPPAGVHGLMLFLTSAICGDITHAVQQLSWTHASTHLAAGCTPVTEWHVVAGWPNKPVAIINYVESGRPVPTPPVPSPLPASTPPVPALLPPPVGTPPPSGAVSPPLSTSTTPTATPPPPPTPGMPHLQPGEATPTPTGVVNQ